MIINASGRTDICAFYTPWFLDKLQKGYLEVRNPFNKGQKKTIPLSPEAVDLIVFCTKNPLPMQKHLLDLTAYCLLFQVTITPYGKEIEPYVPNKKEIIESFQFISKQLGKEHIFLRYDPIFINQKYTYAYHLRAFERLCQHLAGYTSRCIISFLDEKKNTKKHYREIKYQSLCKEQMLYIAKQLVDIASKYGITLTACAEEVDLQSVGVKKEACISPSVYFKLTGKSKVKKSRNRKHCHCLQSIDIGSYNCCPHFCKYCYANYEEEKVKRHITHHFITDSAIIEEKAP